MTVAAAARSKLGGSIRGQEGGILVMIDNNPSSMHREYNEFYAVHVYLQSIRIILT